MALTTRKYVTGDNNVRDCAVDETGGVDTFVRSNPELEARVGTTGATAASSDTGTFSLIALFKRLLQRFTVLIGLLPAELDVSGGLKVAIVAGGSSGGATSAEFDSTAITVGTTTTQIVTVDVSDYQYLSAWIENTGATALNEFQVSVRYHSGLGGAFNPVTFDDADFNTNAGRQTGNALLTVVASSGIGGNAPRTLAGGANGWLELNVSRVESVRFVATVASGSTTLRMRGILK